MTSTEAKDKLQAAYQQLLDNDAHLLNVGVGEQSATSKLTQYVQNEFTDWDVDAEYNRNGKYVKKLNGASVRPDIIVHHRGTDDNLIVIEAKKAGYRGEDNDEEKLKAYKSELGYKFAYKIILGSATSPIQEVIG